MTSSFPSSPFPSRPEKLQHFPPLWTQRSGAPRAGAAGTGARASRARGEDARPGRRRAPAGKEALPALGGEGAAARTLSSDGTRPGGARGAGARAPGPGSAPASPLPAAQPGDPDPHAARGQTQLREEAPRGRKGRRKVVASPRQGILNYRLKASKTVHRIFHVSADAATKGNTERGGAGGRGEQAPSRRLSFSSLFYYLCKCRMH